MKKLLLAIAILMFATPSIAVTRLYDRVTGGIIDADKDDAEFDNTNDALNNHESDTSAHDATGGVVGVSKSQLNLSNKGFIGDTSFFQGADILVYSTATATTLKAKIDGATGALIAGQTHAGEITNCGFSNSGTTLTIAGHDGTALSETNPCVIAIRSNTIGRVALSYFTANVTVTHGGSSDTDGNLFGIQDRDWINVMPLFLGVIYNGTTPYFTLSRVPLVQSGAAASDLCQKGDTDCDATTDVMILTSGLTLSDWTGLPITQVGWFDATYATSGGQWTFNPVAKNGFNDGYEKEQFTMPGAQMGATSSNAYLLDNGGTPPVFTTNNILYTPLKNGFVRVWWDLTGDGGTDGSGAVETRLAMPYVNTNSFAHTCGNGFIRNPTASSLSAFYQISGSDSYVTVTEETNTDASQHGDYTNGTRTIDGFCIYRPF